MDRAKQFLPFAALKGYEEMVEEKRRSVDEEMRLDAKEEVASEEQEQAARSEFSDLGC